MAQRKQKTKEPEEPRPPQFVASEKVILYSLLEDANLRLLDRLTPGMFYDPHHAVLFEIINDRARGGHTADIVAIHEYISREDLWEDVGGPAKFGELTDFKYGLPQIENHVRDVVNAWMRRESQEIAQQHRERVSAGDGDPIVEIEVLVALLAAARATGERACGQVSSDGYSLKWVNAHEITTVPIDWLIYPYMPVGYLVGMVGDEGLGKSYMTCSFAAGVSTGQLFTGETCEPGGVMMLYASVLFL